ncbi:MAG: F0F1 ATP synthase subunit B [Acidobacteriota bacterium]
MKLKVGLATAAMSFVSVAASMATEEMGEFSLFAGDLGNAFWTLLIFILVIVVLGKFAWTPLLNSLQRREEFIRASLEEAKNDRETAQARLEEYEQKLTEARTEASSIIDQAKSEAESLRVRLEQQAREDSESMIDRAKREIDIAKQTAVKELYTTSAELATGIAGKILGRELNPADHDRLIRDSIGEIENLEEN